MRRAAIVLLAMLLVSELTPETRAQGWPRLFLPEQRSIQVRDPAQLPHARIPDMPAPPTVTQPQTNQPERQLSLDEAIRVALSNSTVVRVLAGVSAGSSGRTIYDTAIANTAIDEQRARFDPTVHVDNAWNREEKPEAAFLDPDHPTQSPVQIAGLQRGRYDLQAGVSKQTLTGGQLDFGVTAQSSRLKPGVFPLNPENRSALELSYQQPLLQGGGWAANVAPLVVARIDTERSYFQFKDAVQEYVRGVIEAYWALVAARTEVWARQWQVEQAEWAWRRAKANLGLAGDRRVEAQARVTAANYRATLIAAEASVLQREAALRNIMGLPPTDGQRLVPVSPPATDRLEPDWQEVVALAEERRPDLIELKLIIEADQQLLLQSRNQALPRVDAVALYRWNGLEGELPSGDRLRSEPGQFTDWTFGVNFSVPLGMRKARAQLRSAELVIARDRANLDQGLHNAGHVLAENLRNMDQAFAQYEAYREARAAAQDNVQAQRARYDSGLRGQGNDATAFLYVLLAINDWGNAVSSEAGALTRYNIELANLERQTGTILETHGVRFYEERYGSLGPLGRWACDVCYPADLQPTPNEDRYPTGTKPAEDAFDIQRPDVRRRPAPQRLEAVPLSPDRSPDVAPLPSPSP